MSIDLEPIDLSAAVVGTTGMVDWTGKIQTSGATGLRPGKAHIRLYNESGCGLRFKWGQTSNGDRIPSGAWPVFEIPDGVTTLNYTVETLMAPALVKQLGPTIYEPGETVPETPALGNSPVGGSLVVASIGDLDQYLVSAGVLSGILAAKDVSVANQLDVTAGVAFLKQPSTSVEPVAFGATQLRTSTPSATYFLDLNPDGTVSWGAAHSPLPNALAVWVVVTDGSGNISTVTPQGNYATISILPNANGTILLGQAPSAIVAVQGTFDALGPVGIVGGQSTAGALGVPPIVADSGVVVVAVTTLVTILTFTIPANGRYRLSPSLLIGNGTAGNKPTLKASYTNGAGAADSTYFYGEDVNGTGNVRALNGTNVTLPAANNNLAILCEVLEMRAGTLTVTYQTTGTPNDRVSVLVERVG